MLAAAPLAGAPVALRHKVLNDPQLISFSAPLGGPGWGRDGFPPPEPDEPRKRRIAGGLIAAMVAILVAVGLVLFGGDDDAPSIAAPPVHRTTTTVGEDFAPWPTDAPTSSTSPKRTTTTLKRTTTTRARAVVTTVPPTTTTTAPPLTVSASTRSRSLTCGSSTAVTATASEPVSDVFLSWRETDPSTGRLLESGGKNMDGSGTSWSDSLGPFSQAGHVVWTVSASGAQDSHTIEVTDC